MMKRHPVCPDSVGPVAPAIRVLTVSVMCVLLGSSLVQADPNQPDKTQSGTALKTKPFAAVEKGFRPIFDGRSLEGWEGNADLWQVEDGMIVGKSPGIKRNEFLATRQRFQDFELRLQFRLHDGKGNSGIQFRSRRAEEGSGVIGYQADIGERYWGCLYDEERRRKVLQQAPAELEQRLQKGDWNDYVIRAQGDQITLKVNGVKTVSYREEDPSIAREGIIALQIHSGPAMRIDFRNIRLRELKAAAGGSSDKPAGKSN